jgi:hypothetical protein
MATRQKQSSPLFFLCPKIRRRERAREFLSPASMIFATGGTKELISCIKQAQVWIKDAQAIALIRQ